MKRAAVASDLIFDANLIASKIARVDSSVVYFHNAQGPPITVNYIITIKRASLHSCAFDGAYPQAPVILHAVVFNEV